MEEQFFWFVATLSCVLAFGFAFKHKQVCAASARPVHPELATGQGKDNWAICVVVWLAIFAQHSEGREVVLVLGALVLLWTGWRTLCRLLLLRDKQ